VVFTNNLSVLDRRIRARSCLRHWSKQTQAGHREQRAIETLQRGRAVRALRQLRDLAFDAARTTLATCISRSI
jgi:hypothetical protein